MTIRGVIFDFDGTLVQSVAIKHESYFLAVADIAGGEAIFRDIIRDFPTMTRYSGCALFVERCRARGIDTPSAEVLAARYTRACEDAIAAAPRVPGAWDFLDWLAGRMIAQFLVSGTPEEPLRAIAARLGIADRFAGIFGAPTAKPEHYARIATGHRLRPDELLVVGDGDDDKVAAAALGARFVRVGGGAGMPGPGETAVTALDEIPYLPGIDFGEADKGR